MKQVAILEYTFLFDPEETWDSGSKFEANLADFFAAHGYEANVVETRGTSSRRVIHLTRMDKLEELAKNPPRNNKSPQQILKQMAGKESEGKQKFEKARFLKTKGYLKRNV